MSDTPTIDEPAAVRDETADTDATQAVSAQDTELPKAQFDRLSGSSARQTSQDVGLDLILDVAVSVTLELGRTSMTVRELLQLNQGSVVEFDRRVGEPLDLLVNGTLLAHGELVVIDNGFGIRLTEVMSPSQRLEKLN